jgi:membrane-bound hydrogenase subunit beta
MEKEQKIIDNLLNKFDFLKDNCQIIRDRRITLQVPSEQIMTVLAYLKDSLKFDQLCTITGLDSYEYFQAIYHVAEDNGIVLNVKLNIPKDKPVIKTVTKIFEGAAFYERELNDLLGIEIDGLPEGRRYPLPDSWPNGQYPLRKDWKKSSDKSDGGNING